MIFLCKRQGFAENRFLAQILDSFVDEHHTLVCEFWNIYEANHFNPVHVTLNCIWHVF